MLSMSGGALAERALPGGGCGSKVAVTVAVAVAGGACGVWPRGRCVGHGGSAGRPAGEVCGREGVELVSAVIQGHQSEATF